MSYPAHLLKDIPKGHWVALSADESRVVAHGRDLGKVIRAAEGAGESHSVITGVSHSDML